MILVSSCTASLQFPGSFYAEQDFVQRPEFDDPQGLNTLFVIEAKLKNISLATHVPQAIMEMYACSKRLGSAMYSLVLEPIPHQTNVFFSEKQLSVEL